jgi:O-acetylhomoserine/O-acetylserine sulfhydrylase-like pyridoxal-dependent enzyme
MLTKWPSQLLRHSRHYTAPASSFRAVQTLPDASLTTFRDNAFVPAVPSLLPQASCSSIPAIQKWFHKSLQDSARYHLNTNYLKKWGSAVVPLEITNEDGKFAQIHQPLQFFLECVSS